MPKQPNVRAIFCLAALASFSSPSAFADDAPDCRLTKYATVEMQSDTPKRVLIPATLEGHEKLLFVDTGSPISTLNESTVDELKLPRQMFAGPGMEFAEGMLVHQYTTVSSFQLGGMNGQNIRFAIAPHGLDPVSAGLLGADILRNYDMEFDFANNKINLFSPHHCPGKVIYWTREPYAEVPFHFSQGHHILIPVRLDNVSMTGIVDTGAPAAVAMNVDLARTYYGWKTDPPELKPVGDSEGIYTYPFSLLSIGGASVRYPSSRLESKFETGGPDLLVGLEALRAFHVYISYEDEKIYLTARDAH